MTLSSQLVIRASLEFIPARGPARAEPGRHRTRKTAFWGRIRPVLEEDLAPEERLKRDVMTVLVVANEMPLAFRLLEAEMIVDGLAPARARDEEGMQT